MDKIELKTNAKINLSLDVIKKRADGYHDLKMIMQSISLCDTVTITKTQQVGTSLTTNVHHLPVDDGNIAHKAATLFFRKTNLPPCGIHIHLEKQIPVAAGLAGGSSNSAGVLVGLNRMFDAGLSPQELREIGVELGADVPFSIMGGTALAQGIGDKLTPLPSMPFCYILLVKPKFNVSTPKIFNRLRVKEISYRPDTQGMLKGLEMGDLKEIAHRLYNVLEDVTASDHGEIKKIERKMIDLGAMGSVMSGSGPTVFGIFSSQEKAKNAYRHFRQSYQETYLCNPV